MKERMRHHLQVAVVSARGVRYHYPESPFRALCAKLSPILSAHCPRDHATALAPEIRDELYLRLLTAVKQFKRALTAALTLPSLLCLSPAVYLSQCCLVASDPNRGCSDLGGARASPRVCGLACSRASRDRNSEI